MLEVDYGLRNDGTRKSTGYFGTLKTTDGTNRDMTEFSVGVNFSGDEMEIPTLIPSLTKDELNHLLSGNDPTSEIINKAVKHAKGRIENNKSPFWGSGEEITKPPTAMRPVRVKGVANPMQFPDNMDINDIREFLRKRFTQQAVAGNQPADLAALQGQARATEQSLVEKAGQGISNALVDSGIISNRFGAQQIGQNVTALGEFLPGIGDAVAGDDFGRALKQGDNFGMAMSALGAIPLVGGIAKKAVDKVRITHGSLDPNFAGEIIKGGDGNIFDGLFASYGDESNYGGIKQITYEVDKDKIMDSSDADDRYEDTMTFIKSKYPDADEDALEDLYSIIAEDSNVFEMSNNPLEDYGYDDLGEASWEGQRKRGELAKFLGFDAVDVSDEFGTSVLIPYGSNAKIVNPSTDKAMSVSESLKSKYPDLSIGVRENDSNIILDKVIVPEKQKGTGTKFMNDLIDDADSKGKPIGLTPSIDFGGNKRRLTEFYKRFGFIDNKGKNKDFEISESLIRPANKSTK